MAFSYFGFMSPSEWISDDHIPYSFKPTDSRRFSDDRLPGTVIAKASANGLEILLQEWKGLLTQLACRILHAVKKIKVVVRETRPGMRIEIVLKGELLITTPGGKKERLRAGQYHLTNAQHYRLEFNKDTGCNYIVSHCPPELIRELGLTEDVKPTSPRPVPREMSRLVHQLLHNPYNEKVRGLYYSNWVRELLLVHLVSKEIKLPGEITEDDIAAAQQADHIIGTDLSMHYTIRTLARKVGTNVSRLKKTFKQLYGVGPFERLLLKRMEHAKFLLATTNKPIKEVAVEAGYADAGNFITAFGENFDISPLKWRMDNSGDPSW